MRILKKKILVAGATALLSTSAFAGDINWSGFMSVVGGQVLDSDVQLQDPDGPGPAPASPTELQTYNTGFLGYNGGTYNNDFTFEQESMIGLQGQMLITDKLRATLQVVARGGDAWNATTEWAYLSYSLNDEFTINAGRIRLPLYYFSDFLDVGYAYDWVRPPVELYSGNSGVNGVSTNYSTYLGDWEITNQTWYGSELVDVPNLGDVVTTDYLGTAFLVGINNLYFRASYAQNKFKVTNPDFPLPPSLQGERKFQFSGLAVMYDIAGFKLKVERTEAEVDLEGTDPWLQQYASVAYSFNNFTPHFTYVEAEANPVTATPATETKTLGVAWDFHPSARMKLEYSIKEEVDTFFDFQTLYEDDVKLVTVALDIVF